MVLHVVRGDKKDQPIFKTHHVGIGIVSAPLWSSQTHSFAGMLTVSDFISLIQYYYTNQTAQQDIETMRLSHLTKHIKQNYPIHPMTTLYDAAILMSSTRAHRIPLMDSKKEIVSVMTQYRLMKFIATNVILDAAGLL